jgi:hypothetical protein
MSMDYRKIMGSVFLVCTLVTVRSQNEQDVLRYSYTNLTGTARSLGCGNAFGALGADYSSLVTNPAGLARYRKSELGLSVNFFNNKANTFYIDNVKSDSKFKLNLDNLGLALAIKSGDEKGWKYVNLGVGVNRINNFNRTIYFEGVNTKSSIVQHYEQAANGRTPGQLGNTVEYLAWYQYLIDNYQGDSTSYFSDFTNDSSFMVKQRSSIEQSGGMNDISIALSGNYDDKFYIGGSLNIYRVNFEETNTFLEDVLNNSVDNYKKLTVTNSLSTNGTGIGAKIGVIALPADNIRIGLAYHTPARLFLTDNYGTTLSTTIGSANESRSTQDGIYDYSITIPGKVAVSGAYILGKEGFISADYEYVNYASAKIRAGTDQTSNLDTFTLGVNNNVRTLYKGASNIRFGGEYIFKEVYAVRAGFGIQGSPYSDKVGVSNFKTSVPFLSAGFGIRTGSYFLDLAISRNYGRSYYAPYNLNPGSGAQYYTSETQTVTTNFTTSLGFKF